jgi:hypothetical protein
MSDVYAVFGTLLALGIVFPGLIFTWWLLFPNLTARAEARLAQTPGRTFFFGLLLAIVITVMVLILLNLPLPGANFFAVVMVLGALAVAAVGMAGMTNRLAQRLRDKSNAGISPAGGFLRAIIVLELAAAFPFLGWFFFIPLCLVISLGAAGFSLWSRLWKRPVAAADETPIVVQVAGGRDAA